MQTEEQITLTHDSSNKGENNPTRDIFNLASKVGESIGGKIGSETFPILLLGLTTKLFPKKFSDVKTLRSRLHILLYWQRGFLKTTLLREFFKLIPTKFKTIHLTSSTTETLVGSINLPKSPFQKPRIIPPVYAGVDIVIINEHTTHLKHGGHLTTKLSIDNDALEGDIITNTLIKLGQIQIDPAQISELEELGVNYDPQESTISYEPDFIMFSASHPFDRKTLGILIDAGHFGRFLILQYKITSRIARDFFTHNYALDTNLQKELKIAIEALFEVPINVIEVPPDNLLTQIYEKIFRLTEVPNLRLKGDFLRMIAAHMVIRNRSNGNIKETYTKQDYSIEDAEFVSERLENFVEPRINPLVAEGLAGIKKPRKRDSVKSSISRLLKVSKSQGRVGESLETIHKFVLKDVPGVHYQTVVNALKDLQSEAAVERVPNKFGYYRIVKSQENK